MQVVEIVWFQGRAFVDGSITQDISDPNNVYQIVGSDK